MEAMAILRLGLQGMVVQVHLADLEAQVVAAAEAAVMDQAAAEAPSAIMAAQAEAVAATEIIMGEAMAEVLVEIAAAEVQAQLPLVLEEEMAAVLLLAGPDHHARYDVL